MPIHQVAVGEYQASSVSHNLVWFFTFTTSVKESAAGELGLMLPKYCKTFDSPNMFASFHHPDWNDDQQLLCSDSTC